MFQIIRDIFNIRNLRSELDTLRRQHVEDMSCLCELDHRLMASRANNSELSIRCAVLRVALDKATNAIQSPPFNSRRGVFPVFDRRVCPSFTDNVFKKNGDRSDEEES